MRVPIELTAGINKELTPTANRAGWSDGDKVRFFQGLPETIPGSTDSSAGAKFNGVCRGLHIWQTLSGQIVVALGTTTQLYIWSGGVFFDVTPLRRDQTISNPFSVTNGSSTVVVTDPGHGLSASGDLVFIAKAQPAGGIAFDGFNGLQQATLIDQNSWSFTTTVPVTATTTGGGANVELEYYIPTGSSIAAPDVGYGVGPYGAGTYGTPRITQGSTASISDPRSWSLDNWGEDLIANPSDGGIYTWKASNGTSVRAQLITQAPPNAAGIIVSQPDRHLVAIGGGFNQQDKLLVNFSDKEDYTTWTATDLNTAGSQRVPAGSRLLQIVRTRGEMLLLSDTQAYAMRFEGFPYVFGFFPVGTLCGAVSRNCAVDLNGTTYWMGRENFYQYNGRVTALPCPVRDFVFDNIDHAQRAKVYAGVVRMPAAEVWWLYQDKFSTTGENNRYIAYSTSEGTYHIGSIDRTAVIDGEQINFPLMTGINGTLYYHEVVGQNPDGIAFIETGDFTYGEGDSFFFLDRIIPDFQKLDPRGVDIYVKWRRYPGTVQSQKGPYTITPGTEFVSTRVRSRQQSLRFQSSDAFRLGRVRVNIKPDGRR